MSVGHKSQTSTDPRILYCSNHSLRLHPVQEKLIKRTLEHPWCRMLGSTDELQLIMNLLKMIKAKKTIDVGVYTGYSALSAALALPPDGKVIACDISEEFTSIGKPFWKEAGVDGIIDLRIAPAGETMQSLIGSGEAGTFDFIFIDANKTDYDEYYEKALILLRPGGFIAIDNVLWGGKVFDEANNDPDPDTVALRLLNDKIHKDKRVDVSMLTIGDGTTLVFKPYA
ncbi:probable caffeoyl-CoA O-methyltransferase 2 [Lineus longissimus]|uniref:probable caffeoyl-CoA O-methyltransferase 2 n=1 Tax=Lineus longissimus TaxID=88925 RepID=UPI002B4F771F